MELVVSPTQEVGCGINHAGILLSSSQIAYVSEVIRGNGRTLENAASDAAELVEVIAPPALDITILRCCA